MRPFVAHVAVVAGSLVLAAASPQMQTPARTDIYHVHFTKAAPGQAAELGKALIVPDKTAPMPDHFMVLRHQEGDDWDYAVIQHLGPKATIDAAGTPPGPAGPMRAWHDDTFVAGPSWGEFTKAMGIGAQASSEYVYILSVHRQAPGHREQLEKALTAAGTSKVQTGTALFHHLEGGDWTFMSLTRYNSWQDLASDRAAATKAAAGTAGTWADIRQHQTFHRDTIADRIFPR
jgi:hypothetical protein